MAQYIEAQANEVFLGNVKVEKVKDGIPDYLKTAGLQTLRFGTVALDINGKILPGYQPVFIDRQESDVYDRIMTERFKMIK